MSILGSFAKLEIPIVTEKHDHHPILQPFFGVYNKMQLHPLVQKANEAMREAGQHPLVVSSLARPEQNPRPALRGAHS